MSELIEVPPFIHTNGNEDVKNELYLKHFDIKYLGNITGSMPLMGIDYNETESAYTKRLRCWKQADMNVIFDGWSIKDLKQFQIATDKNGNTIQFDFNSYSVTIESREYKFPLLPETIDDFINDCKRIGLKLFWKQEIINKFDADHISSEKKVVEYHKILKNLNN